MISSIHSATFKYFPTNTSHFCTVKFYDLYWIKINPPQVIAYFTVFCLLFCCRLGYHIIFAIMINVNSCQVSCIPLNKTVHIWIIHCNIYMYGVQQNNYCISKSVIKIKKRSNLLFARTSCSIYGKFWKGLHHQQYEESQ